MVPASPGFVLMAGEASHAIQVLYRSYSYPEKMPLCPLCVYSWWNDYEIYIKGKCDLVLIYRMNIRLESISILDIDV